MERFTGESLCSSKRGVPQINYISCRGLWIARTETTALADFALSLLCGRKKLLNQLLHSALPSQAALIPRYSGSVFELLFLLEAVTMVLALLLLLESSPGPESGMQHSSLHFDES